jgi:hypothetical protein
MKSSMTVQNKGDLLIGLTVFYLISYYYPVCTSASGLLVPGGIIYPVVSG